MKKPLVLITLYLFFSACSGDFGDTFSFDRDVPDEFSVTRRASLTRPPDLYLRPPRTETRKDDVRIEGVLEIITGSTVTEKEKNFEGTPALKSFLKEIGAFEEMPPDLRTLLDGTRKDKLEDVSDETLEEILQPQQ